MPSYQIFTYHIQQSLRELNLQLDKESVIINSFRSQWKYLYRY